MHLAFDPSYVPWELGFIALLVLVLLVPLRRRRGEGRRQEPGEGHGA